MHENIRQFEVSVHDLIFDEGFEGMKNLNKELDSLFFRDGLVFLKILREISFVTVLEDEVEVVGSLLDVIQLDNVLIVTSPQYLDLIFKQLQEFS